MYAIVRIVADQPGFYLHYENLANDLKLSAKTISKYISVLEQAFVIKVLYNYSANQLTSEKKMKRFISPHPLFAIHFPIRTTGAELLKMPSFP